ncbi:MAG: methylmalonyl-CoA epimerase [Rhodothermaceae bacterium]|nr:MAG: methylmalonyl-CoA epimerase [Rhodothermaceae bacterium]
MTRLEHIGIAVRDAAAVIDRYERLLEVRPYKAETVEREGVRTHFIAAGPVKLELLEALGPESPVARFLEKRGEGLHHLAFEVDDVDATMARLRALGLQPLSEEPRPGADGKRIFFLHPKQTYGVLVEFCQSVPTPLPVAEVVLAGRPQAVHYLGDPAAPAVVLFTGAAAHPWAGLEPVARRLEPFFHLLAPADPLDGDDLPALIDAFEHKRAHVLALGAGAAPALDAARIHPERVSALALVEPDLDPQRPLVGLPPALLVGFDESPHLPPVALFGLHTAWPGAALAILPGPGLRPMPADLDALVAVLRRHLGG